MSTREDSERAAEGVVHRIWSQEGTRILLAVVGALLVLVWNGQQKDNENTQIRYTEISKSVNEMQSDLRNINTRLDEGVIRQVADHKEAIRSLEQRVGRLESRAKLP